MYGFGDDDARFIYFNRALLEMLRPLGFVPDVIHVHDAAAQEIAGLGTDQVRGRGTLLHPRQRQQRHRVADGDNGASSALGRSHTNPPLSRQRVCPPASQWVHSISTREIISR